MTYVCPVCSKSSSSLKGLSIHCRKSHNINRESLYELLHGIQTTACECSSALKFKSMSEGWEELCGKCRFKKSWSENEHVPWNKGLTKETSDSLKQTSEKLRAHYEENDHWSLGLTKETSGVISKRSRAVSESLKTHYEENDHWSLGLTSDMSDVIRQRSLRSGNTQRGKNLTREHRQALANAKLLKGSKVDECLSQFGFERLTEYTGNQTHLTVKCATCGSESQKTLHAISYGSKCHTCSPPWQSGASKWQLEVDEFVRSIGHKTCVDDRSALDGKEIDVFVPNMNFGIECDGLYWHSMAPGRCTPTQQEEKRLLAQSKGIDVWFIFQDEWEQKQEIVKSMISHRLQSSNIRRVHGRKCKVEYCKPIELREFIDSTHIEGYVPANFGIKLLVGDEIVGACTLRWLRGAKKTKLEIARLSFMKMTHVNGGVSRLIVHAKRVASDNQAVELISYADNRLGGQCYSQFLEFQKLTSPRFWWTDFAVRYNRFKYRANKGRGLSEHEVAQEASVSKIYGSSNSLFSCNLR